MTFNVQTYIKISTSYMYVQHALQINANQGDVHIAFQIVQSFRFFIVI